MSSPKILLVKKLPEETRVSSVVVGETGFYWRSFANPQEVAAALQKEDFGLLFFDHRGVPGDPLAFVDSVRGAQKKTPVFLISDPMEMSGVIQAIRLGVKDYFQPPLDLRLIIERVQLVLEKGTPSSDAIQLEKWSEFVMFLADGSGGNTGGSASSDARKSAGVANVESQVKVARDGLATEMKTLRDEVFNTRKKCERLEAELTALKSVPEEKGKGPSLLTEGKVTLELLQQELEEEREELETERLLFKQEQKKFETLQSVGGNSSGGIPRREPNAADRKAVGEKDRQIVAAQGKLEEELMQLVEAKARLEKEHAARRDQLKAGLAEIDSGRKAIVSEQAAFDRAKSDWEKTLVALRADKAKLEVDLAAREQAFSRVGETAKKLAENENRLVVEQENLETEKNLFDQAKNKQEKLRAETEERFTQRENALVDRALALDAEEKVRSEAEDLFLVEQEKLDSAQVQLTQDRQSFEQARVLWEKEQASAKGERARTEADFARREKALAGLDDELKKIANAQTKLATEQEKLESAHNLLSQSQTKLEQNRLEIEARQAKREGELVKRAQTLADQDKLREAVEKQLQTDRKKLDEALVAANQTQVRMTRESKALEHAKAQWDKSVAEAQAENAKAEVALQKRLKDISDRREQVLQKEKCITLLNDQMAAEQEKLEAEQLVVSQTLTKITSERAHVAVELTRLEKLKHELTEQEAIMEETEVKTQTQLTQLKKIQAQVAADQATLAKDKAVLAQESAALGERVGQFEARQQQFKDQMKQMLSGS